jgi:hypothetical protein
MLRDRSSVPETKKGKEGSFFLVTPKSAFLALWEQCSEVKFLNQENENMAMAIFEPTVHYRHISTYNR